MTEYTILMPCLNEAVSLPFCIEEAKRGIASLGLNAEILIADNCSADGSADLARSLGARVVTVEEKGYGAALLAGIRAANGTFIIMGDADGSYDFSALAPFVQALQEGNELVMGNRFLGGIEPGAMPWSHRIGVPALSALARLRFRAPVGDFHCGIRAFRREAALALELRCTGMEFATELIAAFARSGATIAEVPAVLRCDRRNGGRPHLRTVRDGLRHLYFIVFEQPLPRK
ncbi:MAG: glycosyltransferase family 2 protein [Oscillospiraceae bacterium]|nr:glycosyltransferase family 2 protein [Oscillospiraceae bacterium]